MNVIAAGDGSKQDFFSSANEIHISSIHVSLTIYSISFLLLEILYRFEHLDAGSLKVHCLLMDSGPARYFASWKRKYLVHQVAREKLGQLEEKIQ